VARGRGLARRAPIAVRSRPRESIWLNGVTTRTSLGSGGAALVASLDATALASRPFTVIRTRGVIHAVSDQLIATEPYQVFFGLAVVSEQASAIGITAVPTPATESGSALFLVFESLISEFVFVTGAGFDSAGGVTRVVDSKAMRRVEEGQDLVMIAEVAPVATSEGLRFTQFMRVLIKLH